MNSQININDEFIEQINKLYNDSDYVSLIKYSKENSFDKILELASFLFLYLDNLENLISIIRVSILVGVANYRLGKYKQATGYFSACLKILDNIDEIIKFLSGLKLSKLLSSDNKLRLKALFKIRKDNKFLRPIIYAYIAHSQLKKHAPFSSAVNYRKAFKSSFGLNLNNNEHKDIYIDILLGRSDAYYEITKVYITTFKILVFVLFASFVSLHFFDEIRLIFLGLYKSINHVFFCICLPVVLLSFSKIFYKIFYFFLRKLRRFISVYFLKLFPEPFNDKLIDVLNYINLKKILSYRTHKQAIEKIESISKKDFNTFFAIAKLYYCLGSYKNATFYIQKALSCHNKENKSELAMAYHYLGRISYKTSNNSTAIDFYNKAIENLMSINKTDKDYKIEYLPSISDMIKYSQENINKIEQTTFSRTYLPLIITLIITMFVCIAQIYYAIPQNENQALNLFKTLRSYCTKLLNND